MNERPVRSATRPVRSDTACLLLLQARKEETNGATSNEGMKEGRTDASSNERNEAIKDTSKEDMNEGRNEDWSNEVAND